MLVSLGWLTALAAGVFAVLVGQKWCFPYFWKDLFFLARILSRGLKLEVYTLTSRVFTVLDKFVQQAARTPDKTFVIFEGNGHTYGDIDARSDKVAQVFDKLGTVQKGDTVALLMNNEPDFLCVWFGLSKLGCAVAFLNTNIKSVSLLHCFGCCGARILVVGKDLLETLEEILPSLQEDGIQVWAVTSGPSLPGVRPLLDELELVPARPVPANRRAVTSLRTPTLYIFTSGTTGLPKAAVISHLQSLKGSAGYWAYGATSKDVVYIPLPLYHSAASVIGIGGVIDLGATCVLKKKFSASQFWADCRRHDVTMFQYIGELCRYLCNQPQAEGEKEHKVRMGVGNGLRQDVWRELHRRFGEIRMCELYGSTEGNLCFMNHVGKIGAVGRSNFFYKLIFKYELVKYDMEKDAPLLNKHGFCQRVEKGEPGLLLSKVNSRAPFFGYAGSKQLTEKKLMRDVFEKGDQYVNTGDLMVEDREDFISFRDRLGDTFRWKGENVATTEVAEILGLVDFIQAVNVYGVEVPGSEGRAGMAAVIIRPDRAFDGRKLFDHVVRYLPAYARPLFIRIQEFMEMTGTLKLQKFRLVESGFNPASISDPLYFLDGREKRYVPLDEAVYGSIVSGTVKL